MAWERRPRSFAAHLFFLLHGRDLLNHLRRIQFEVLRRESSPRLRYLSVCHPNSTRSVRASAFKQLSLAEWKYHTALVLANSPPLVEPELNSSWSTEYLH